MREPQPTPEQLVADRVRRYPPLRFEHCPCQYCQGESKPANVQVFEATAIPGESEPAPEVKK